MNFVTIDPMFCLFVMYDEERVGDGVGGGVSLIHYNSKTLVQVVNRQDGSYMLN
jgi:hypothetical protein